MNTLDRNHCSNVTCIWDTTGIRYDPDTGMPITGQFRSLSTTDVNGVSVYASSFSVFTGGVIQIPPGTKSWSIGVVSGNIFINGAGPLTGPVSINGGGYNGRTTLGSAITVSGSIGAKALLLWEV